MKQIKKKQLSSALFQALGTGVALALAASAANAQQTEKIEVTGSNIKRVDSESTSPVQIITRDQIQNSGQRDLAELLRGISAVSAGSGLDTSGNSFSAGAQTIALRGLGASSTLVLVNGRRLSPSAYADPNAGRSVVYDLNQIPLDAIERIEVLKDGASAIYGSDAMAGVVNLILRKDFKGAEVGASYNTNESRMWTNWRANATLGFGDLAKQNWNVLASFEHFHRDPVNIKDVANVQVEDNSRIAGWRTTLSTNGYPGNYFRENVLGNNNFATFVGIDRNCPTQFITGTGTSQRCRYDLLQDVNLVFKQDRDSVYLRGTYNINNNMSAFGEFGYSRVKSAYFSTPSGFSNALSIWASSTGALRIYRLVLPVGHPDNPTTVPVAVAYTFADVGRRSLDQTTETYRTLVGLKGTAGSWDYETAFLRMSNEREDRNTNYLSFAGLQSVVNDQSYRFNGQGNSQPVLDRLRTGFVEKGEASVTSWDLRGTREFFNMAGGPLAVAAGLEVRKEEIEVVSDPKILAGEIVGRGTSSANGNRNVTALYAELSVPFIRRLETQLAVRGERYSDFGNSTTPKIGLKYLPIDQLALRGTWAKGFRAPSLSQIADSSVQAFNNGFRDPLRCPVFDSTNRDCSFSLATYIRANPALQPEKSDNFTAGFIFSPVRNANISADYWSIKRKNQIGIFSSTFVINNESRFPGNVIRDPNPATWLPGVPNSGPLFTVIRQFFNLSDTQTSGVDVDASYLLNLGANGRLNTVFNGTYVATYKYRLETTNPLVDHAGTYGAPGDAIPRFKGNISSTWSQGPYSVMARVNYVRGWYLGPGGVDDQAAGCFYTAAQLLNGSCWVKPWTTIDLGFNYTGIKNVNIGFLVRNIQDKNGLFDPDYVGTTGPGFNTTYHNALGKYYSLNVRYSFK